MGETILRFTVTEAVSASNRAVWSVLGDFGTEHRWTKTLVQCERDTLDVRVGTARTCTLPKALMGRTTVREEITEFEPGAVLAYQLDGSAGPFLIAMSRWTTREAVSERVTLVTVEGTFVPKNQLARFLVWPPAKLMIQRLTRSVLRELAEYMTVRRGLA